MTNPSKKRGTEFETAVVKYLREQTQRAKRQPLSGSEDQGDIIVEGKFFNAILECKNRKSMRPKWLEDLMDETERETVNAKASYGFAVIKREGRGEQSMGDQIVVTNLETLRDLLSRM